MAYWHFQGRARLEMQNVPYALLRNLFSFRFQILDSDSANVAREKMEHGVLEFMPGDPLAGEKAHFIGQLMGLDFSASPALQPILSDAKQIHDRALLYLTQFFTAVTEKDPTVILLEDIHWADDSWLDVFVQLAQKMANQQLLVICATRPGLLERRPHWGEGQAFHTRIDLHPLSKRDSRRLVEEVLQKVDEIPVELRELVVSSAEGNPFYVEELIKMLIEDEVIVKGAERWLVEPARLVTMRVPPTLTGVLQARLDSLSAEERPVLQQAAVVGHIFWDQAIDYIGDQESAANEQEHGATAAVLATLRERELVLHRESSTFADTHEYIFKHELLRDVTYRSILQRVRRAYHAFVAEWLIEHSGERAGEYTGLIAEHLELAGESEQALIYLRKAGEQASEKFANAEALDYFSRALALVPEDERAERYTLLLAREKVYDLLGKREAQAQDLTTLKELAERLNDDGMPTGYMKRAEVALCQAAFGEVTGDYAACIMAAQAAIEFAMTSGEVRGAARGHLQWGRALCLQGDFAVAQTQLGQALALAQEAQLHQVEADSLRNLGIVSGYQGDSAEERDYCKQALRICQEIGDRRGEGITLNNLGVISSEQGDYAGARDYYEQSLRIKREIGDRHGESLTLCGLGHNAQVGSGYMVTDGDHAVL